ncbi:hypothetical protein CONPUDRAFT_126467 [Coniophora puteana RWD-64-598 SS2]|uniref:Uncharacterized protein n=1 Tax=Coniophora puteana (strain RWD-64-598) TaxID=741705 RepID=A0A5M3MLU6_CONPW|nr:uncharacterized protein CONPUDRAFT_126467 [Coniophora puteana RWD-64-598 SS2]EIW80017.1 hypothetical protein CONPUDRAFT_126467 [Coniophora puteana RWD-64-598 SS2]
MPTPTHYTAQTVQQTLHKAAPTAPPPRAAGPTPIGAPINPANAYPYPRTSSGGGGAGPPRPAHSPYDAPGHSPAYSSGAGANPAYAPFEPRKTASEADQDLRELVAGTFEDTQDVDIDPAAALVDGFQEGVRLLPHQVLGRAWMRDRESGKKAGGILADDMGLGKTIQTLARILDGKAKKSDKDDGWAATTLVICPVALVSQWAQEIKRLSTGLRVLEHHGQSRTTDPLKLRSHHVVITSYTTAASEHAAFSPEIKDEGSGSKASKKKASGKKKKASADSDSDEDESDDSVVRAMNRNANAKGKRAGGKAKKDALYRVKWFRVVLDEAHNIKNRNTKSAIACCALEAKYRWALTGTPMQNSVEELYSLIKFLRIRPLNDWPEFNTKIAQPIKSGRTSAPMKRLQVVLRSIMLRRRKDQLINGQPILELPERRVGIVPCAFDRAERRFYRELEARMGSELDKLVREGVAERSYTHVLVLLLRLRQACNHPSLISKNYKADAAAIESRPAKSDDDGDGAGDGAEADELAAMFGALGVSRKCQLCQTELTPSNTTPSSTDHCKACAHLALTSRRKSISGRAPSKEEDEEEGEGEEEKLPPSSAKIRKILEIMRETERRSGGVEKTIVFSQFTSFLDVLGPFLDREGVKHVRYDGSMKKDARDAALEKIRTSKSTRCILISFKAGSTGLNLTACNNVILVDLWWNPALEDQAFDRAHRFGQTRAVNIHKLTIEDTVEQRILELQEKKRALAAAALSGDKLKNMKLGMDDLLALFRGSGQNDSSDDDESEDEE